MLVRPVQIHRLQIRSFFVNGADFHACMIMKIVNMDDNTNMPLSWEKGQKGQFFFTMFLREPIYPFNGYTKGPSNSHWFTFEDASPFVCGCLVDMCSVCHVCIVWGYTTPTANPHHMGTPYNWFCLAIMVILLSCYIFLTYLSLYLSFNFLRSLLTLDSEKQKVTARIRRKRRRRGRARLSTRMTFQRKSTH